MSAPRKLIGRLQGPLVATACPGCLAEIKLIPAEDPPVDEELEVACQVCGEQYAISWRLRKYSQRSDTEE